MRSLPILALAAVLAAAPAVQAQTPPRHDPRVEPNPQERALENAERILRQMLDLLRAIPSYDPPVVTEDGDILIRRRPPRPLPGREPPYPTPVPPEPPTRL
jgi:hypothetical protein